MYGTSTEGEGQREEVGASRNVRRGVAAFLCVVTLGLLLTTVGQEERVEDTGCCMQFMLVSGGKRIPVHYISNTNRAACTTPEGFVGGGLTFFPGKSCPAARPASEGEVCGQACDGKVPVRRRCGKGLDCLGAGSCHSPSKCGQSASCLIQCTNSTDCPVGACVETACGGRICTDMTRIEAVVKGACVIACHNSSDCGGGLCVPTSCGGALCNVPLPRLPPR
eukprot:Hpha_TRINITY_DN16087_c4_g5::TRINITY_DN16087_c4_g5_i1::g.118615::m.118615